MDNPQSHEAAVLGACLIEPACFLTIADYLKPEDFYSEGHREIYAAMADLWSIGEPVNDITVTEELKRKKKLSLAGGAAYICELTLDIPDVVGVESYAKEVKRSSGRRALKRLGTRLQHVEGDPDDTISDTLRNLIDIAADSLRSVPESIGEHVNRVYTRTIAIHDKEIKPTSLLTGLPRFDRITGGLKGSDLVIIGARPSVGKSAFSLFLSKLLCEQGHRGLFVSLEMSSEQIATRLLAAESGVPYTRIQDGYLAKADPELLATGKEKFVNLPLVIDDKANQSIADIQVKARRELARGGLDFIVVDYLQLAAAETSSYESVTEVSKGLKGIAKDLDIPVIALSQLSRMIEQRESRKPMLSDLRQSGQIEQDADLIAFLYVPDKRKKDELCLIVEKHRNGECGSIMYNFEKKTQRFTEIGGGND
jgi:replicative DNA helicase